MRMFGNGGSTTRRHMVTWPSLALAAFTVAAFAAPAQASPGKPLVATTVALWHMDETSGSMMDSANNHDGTVAHVRRGIAGHQNNAYQFNGRSSIVKVGDAPDLNPGTGTFTVTLYVKFTTTPQDLGEDSYDLIRKGLSGVQYWKLEISKTGKFACHFTGSNAVADQLGTGPVLNDGVWHKLSCQKTATQFLMSVDDAQIYSKTVTVGSVSNINLLTLGAKRDPNTVPHNSDFYAGAMDEVRITSG